MSLKLSRHPTAGTPLQAHRRRHTAASTHFLDGAVPAGCRLRLQLLLPFCDGRMCVHADGHLVARRAGRAREGCRCGIGERDCLAQLKYGGQGRHQEPSRKSTLVTLAQCTPLALRLSNLLGPHRQSCTGRVAAPGAAAAAGSSFQGRGTSRRGVAIVSRPTDKLSSVACTSLTSHTFRSPKT